MVGDEMQDVRLAARQTRKVAAHVVEQDAQVVDADGVQRRQFSRQGRARLVVEVAVDFERAQADAEPHPRAPAVGGKTRQRLDLVARMRLPPAAAQEGVGLGGIGEEAVAVRRQEIDLGGALGPGPGAP